MRGQNPAGHHSSFFWAYFVIRRWCALWNSGLTISQWLNAQFAHHGWSKISFRWSPWCHTVSYAAARSRNTTQLYRYAESCLRCIVLVVLLGPPLIYHDGSRLVPVEAVDPPLGRCGCMSIFNWYRTMRWVCTTWGIVQLYLAWINGNMTWRTNIPMLLYLRFWGMTNSGWMLSRPGALPDLNFLWPLQAVLL